MGAEKSTKSAADDRIRQEMKDLIVEAFEKIDRSNFVLPQYRESADLDIPLPIDYGQTISQPSTVRAMFNWLGAHPGDKVLDIGSGSGWTTALLANIVGPTGKVYAVERIPELKKFGQKNCRRAGIKNTQFFLAGAELGLPKEAPFDRILVSAAAEHLPQELISQLKTNGKIVMPVGNSIFEIRKRKNDLKISEHSGFVFVPLIAE